MSELTQAKVRELFDYNPETGILFWRKRAASTVLPGRIAGYRDADGYIRVRINKKAYFAHRLIFLYMIGAWPKHEVDHIDHNGSNNRWDNLRDVTKGENAKNTILPKDNTTGVIGVKRVHSRQRSFWQAYIGINGLQVHLGSFDRLEEAVAVRRAAEAQYFYHPNHGQPSKGKGRNYD